MESALLSAQIDKAAAYLRLRESFADSDLRTVVSPRAITPLGSFLENQGGPVLAVSIDARTTLAFIPNGEGKIRLYNTDLPGVSEFALDGTKTPARDDWGRLAIWCARAARDHLGIERGFTGVLSPAGTTFGPGARTSETLSYLTALAHVNGVELRPGELVELKAEMDRDYLKTGGELADTAAVVYGTRDGLLYIDTNTGRAASCPGVEGGGLFKIMIVHTGMENSLKTALLNERAEECRKAAGFLGIMGGLRSAKSLAFVPERVFLEKSQKLPEELRSRAAHYYSESARVAMGVSAWKAGDMKKFGALMNESCESSFANYGIGSPELVSLRDIVSAAHGVYGCVSQDGVSLTSLVRPDFPAESGDEILSRFTDAYPGLKDRAAITFAGPDDGLRIV